MENPFGCLGLGPETTTPIAEDTVMVSPGSFEGATTIFIGCQASGATLAATGIWERELGICAALASVRMEKQNHRHRWKNPRTYGDRRHNPINWRKFRVTGPRP